MRSSTTRAWSGSFKAAWKSRRAGTITESNFNDLAKLAAQLCQVPSAVIILWDQNGAFLLAQAGPSSENVGEFAAAAQSLSGNCPIQIPEIHSDERFQDHALLTTEPHLHFYAGVPLIDNDGASLGVLCVTDITPHHLEDQQLDALQKVGRQVVTLLDSAGLSASPPPTEESYRRLFESTLDGILIVDYNTGQISDVNPAMASLLGVTAADLLSRKLWEIGFAQHEARGLAAFEELHEHGSLHYKELALRSSTGDLLEVELVAQVHTEQGQQFIQCNFRDVTETKQAAHVDEEFKEFIHSTLSGLAAQIINIDPEDEAFIVAKDHALNAASSDEGSQSETMEPGHLNVGARVNGTWTKEANMVVQGIREVMAKRRTLSEQDETPSNLIEQRWFNAFVTYFMDSELMRIIVARQEVFERITAERQIRFQAKLLDVVGEAVVATDVSGRVTYWNRFAEALYGWTAAEAMGKKVSALVVPRRERRRALEVMAQLRAGESWSGDLVLSSKDGSHFSAVVTNTPIYDNGQLVGTIGISQDITERKRAEAMLRESEERFRLLVESVQDYAIYMLDPNGRISSWNPGAQRLKGYRSDEVMGHHFSLFYLPEEIADGLPEMEIEVATATGRFEGEGIRLRKNGERFWANVTISAIRDEKGNLRGFSKVTRDITERKHAEEELERTNREIVTIWESMTDAFVAVDSNWTLTHVNERAAFIWKKDRDEVIGKNLWDLFPSAVWLSFHREYHRAVRDQIPVVFEEFYPPLNSWLEIHAYPSSLGLSIYFRDISQRKAAEQAIRNSEARFQSIVANAPGMVYQFILHPDGNLAIPFVNDGSRRLFGMTPEDIQSNSDFFQEIIHPSDFEEWERSIQDSARDLAPWDWEGRIKLPSGKIKWVQGAARPKRMPHGGTIWDALLMEITDRKQAEEERDRFFTLSLDMLCICDLEGEFKRLNPAFETTLGYSLHELQGKSFLDFVHPDDRDYTEEQMDNLAHGANTTRFVNRYRCQEGSYKWLSWQIVPYEDLAYAVAHDITPLKVAEAELRNANDELELRVARRTEQLARSNEELRIENIERQMTLASLRQVTEAFRQAKEEADAANLAKSEFLSRMSHELRTPLNAILGFGQILEMRSLEPEDVASISHILKAGWHLLDLVNEILDIARVEAGHLELAMEPIAIADVVPECCSLLRPLADQRDITLDEDGTATSQSYVLADRQRLRQIMINLLSNAIKYNFTGGQVSVSSEVTPSGQIRISVRDTGPGISQQDTKKLFVPFERLGAASSKIEGSGLGLALSQRLLTAMGGRLGVQSELGVGSVFWIELPKTEVPALSLPSANAAESLENAFNGRGTLKVVPGLSDWPDSSKFTGGELNNLTVPKLDFDGIDDKTVLAPIPSSIRPLRILVVEDNQVNQQVILQQLKNLGHEVTLLDNGIAAIETWQQTPMDLILMDCNMPQMNGYVAAREIRSLEPEGQHIPIIALTANAMSGDREKCLASGMDDYLSKPTRQSTLAEVIGRWISNLELSGASSSKEDNDREEKEEKRVTLLEERWNELATELDPGLLGELVRLFLDETPALLETLNHSVSEGNPNAIYQNAHKLKGSCGTMGATGMEAFCREIENLANNGQVSDCEPIVAGLFGEFSDVKDALNASLERLAKQSNI